MSIGSNLLSKPLWTGVILFIVAVAYYSYAAIEFPTLFNLDNPNNFAATKYIAQHQKLPVVKADDNEIFFSESGTTRLSRPPFTYIVSAALFSLTADVVSDTTVRLRLGSPIIGALAVTVVFTGFWLAFSHLGTALLGALIVGLLPKFVFLASCNNDDIGAILSVSLLFTSFIALIKHGCQTRVFIALAFSAGLLLQTKFTAWIAIPWFGIYGMIVLFPARAKLLRLTPMLLTVCIAAGGWWVIFNMINYGLDDPSGLGHIEKVQSTLLDVEPNSEGYQSEGIGLGSLLQNHDQFITKSFKSMIGYLQWIELEVGFAAYGFYGVIFLVGLIGAISFPFNSLEQPRYLDLLALGLIFGQCWFFVHHNLVRDIQPQGRYLLPVIMPLVYLFLRVISRVSTDALILKLHHVEIKFQSIATSVLVTICLMVYVITLTKFITPSFIQQPFYTNISNKRTVRLDTELKAYSSVDINFQLDDQRLELKRTGLDAPTLIFEDEFCQLLPTNALILIQLSSQARGGFHLRLDRDAAGTYEDVYWQSFPAGDSVVTFTVNGSDCTGAKLTLDRNTHTLTLITLEIGELRINQYGLPI